MSTEEKNHEAAFRRSFELGFGTETDVRDSLGQLVISHDPVGGDSLLLQDFLAIHAEYGGCLPLALNIKSDGLQDLLLESVARFDLENFFVFDMSVPDCLSYAKKDIPFYSRMSEYELQPALIDKASGIWLDAFESAWFNLNTLKPFLSMGIPICFVSPELHNRDPWLFWEWLKNTFAEENDCSLLLCTDLPEKASAYFNS